MDKNSSFSKNEDLFLFFEDDENEQVSWVEDESEFCCSCANDEYDEYDDDCNCECHFLDYEDENDTDNDNDNNIGIEIPKMVKEYSIDIVSPKNKDKSVRISIELNDQKIKLEINKDMFLKVAEELFKN